MSTVAEDFSNIGERIEFDEQPVDITAELGTSANNPWIPEDSVLVRLRMVAATYSDYARSYRTFSSLESNRVVWHVPPSEILARAVESGWQIGGIKGQLTPAPFIHALQSTKELLSRSVDPRVQSLAKALGAMSNERFVEALRTASRLLESGHRKNAPTAILADEVRQLSGLSTQALGAIFPVVRESYQRWVSGRTTPSEGDLRRLLALRELFHHLRDRVPNVRNWLFTPIQPGVTPYDLLKEGRISEVWDEAIRLNRQTLSTARNREGEFSGVLEGGVRGRWKNAALTLEDADDLSDWDDEDNGS